MTHRCRWINFQLPKCNWSQPYDVVVSEERS